MSSSSSDSIIAGDMVTDWKTAMQWDKTIRNKEIVSFGTQLDRRKHGQSRGFLAVLIWLSDDTDDVAKLANEKHFL